MAKESKRIVEEKYWKYRSEKRMKTRSTKLKKKVWEERSIQKRIDK